MAAVLYSCGSPGFTPLNTLSQVLPFTFPNFQFINVNICKAVQILAPPHSFCDILAILSIYGFNSLTHLLNSGEPIIIDEGS